MAGKVVHVEIPASDTSRSREFWGSFFGWQFQAMDGPFEYHMTRIDETTGAAVFPSEGAPAGLRTYFDVDDINASTARIAELGGEAGEPAPVPGMGWFAIVKDSEGNEFGLWQNDESAPAPSQ